jgi:2-polyprenyl-6-methoxyphenol hydroxylase-like FAD-dependent oxidoreductase
VAGLGCFLGSRHPALQCILSRRLSTSSIQLSQVGKPDKIEVDVVIGADGANSRVAKEIDAGEYDYAIAFQVKPCIRWLVSGEG